MGSSGPIPKRSSERRRRNKEQRPDVVPAAAERPPRSGPGSSLVRWRYYAASVGVAVTLDMSRDEVIAAVDGVTSAPAGEWHPIAQEWFHSLSQSGQCRFFEPSDWAAARYVAEVMSRNLSAGRFSAQLFASVWSAMSELLTTEGARRRVRIEVARESAGEPAAPAGVTAIEQYRAKLGG